MSNLNIQTEHLLEPDEYFNKLKASFSQIQKDEFSAKYEYIKNCLERAKENGQTTLVKNLEDKLLEIIKELSFISVGIDKYVSSEHMALFIKNVIPKNSVKIIELERFLRPIPTEPTEKLQAVKKLNLFDNYYVLFTDYTDNTYSTPEEEKIKERNRDPILFGSFNITNENGKQEPANKFYYIADWVDEFCDLTLDKLVNKMVKMGIQKPVTQIDEKTLITEIMKDLSKGVQNSNVIAQHSSPQKVNTTQYKAKPNVVNETFVGKIKNLFKRK